MQNDFQNISDLSKMIASKSNERDWIVEHVLMLFGVESVLTHTKK